MSRTLASGKAGHEHRRDQLGVAAFVVTAGVSKRVKETEPSLHAPSTFT